MEGENSNYSYKIIKEKQLVIQCHRGLLNLLNAVKLKQEIYHAPQFEHGYKFLIDIRDSDFYSNQVELTEYSNFIMKNTVNKPHTRTAILTNNPSQVARSLLIIIPLKEKKMAYKLFSTLEAAVVWLGLKKDDVLTIQDVIHDISPKV